MPLTIFFRMLSEKYFSKVLEPKPAGKNRKNASLKLFDTKEIFRIIFYYACFNELMFFGNLDNGLNTCYIAFRFAFYS